MKQYTMRLDLNHQRPVVMMGNGLTALLDTGAYIPIWTDDEKILVSRLGAKLVQKNVRNMKVVDRDGRLHVFCSSAD